MTAFTRNMLRENDVILKSGLWYDHLNFKIIIIIIITTYFVLIRTYLAFNMYVDRYVIYRLDFQQLTERREYIKLATFCCSTIFAFKKVMWLRSHII